MDSGTCDFETWRRRVQSELDGAGLTAGLEGLAREASRAFGAHLWFAEVLGRRWSHVAGEGGAGPTAEGVRSRMLDGRVTLLCDNAESLPADVWQGLTELAEWLVTRPKKA